MSGRKRPYPDDEGVSSTHSPTLVEKRRLTSTLEAVGSNTGSAASLWTTTNIDRCDMHDSYYDHIIRARKPSPMPWPPSTSSGDSLELSIPTETTSTPFTSTSETEASDIRKESNEIEICFGMLVDGLLSVWKRSQIPVMSSSRLGAPTLKPRFRDKGMTILNPTMQEIGVLDNKTASGMVSLKQTVSSVRFEIYAIQGAKEVDGPDGTLEIPLEILVFGWRSFLEQVGSLLSRSSLFLQEPINRQLSVPYRNPHVFSWNEEDETENSSYLLEPSFEGETNITDKIRAVLNDTSTPRLSFQIQQDARITSILKQHQLIALKFMIAREGLMEADRLTLWRPVDRNGRRVFKNDITQSIKMLEPVECRGGILADEMGMGKSLSLLALILYTSHGQRSDKKEYLPYQKDDIWSGATLVIAPKSTIQGWEQQVHKHTRPGALKVHIYHGNGRRITRNMLSQFDIVLTTYETAASDASASGTLSRISWLRIVLDEAHQIRNRSTKNFQELTKLRAERRWCLTGTPVQNKLSDLFSLTQFLGFEPLESHANARKYILEPLSRNDSQGLENLRLALQVISLRRTKQLCRTQRRIEAVEQVILNERERRCYIATRDDARKSLSSVTGKSQGHILLRAISTLRQLCSNGGLIIDGPPEIQPAREHSICDKCGDPIDTQIDSQQSFHGACGHSVCFECTLDQNGAEDTVLDSTSSTCWVCQEPVTPVLENIRQRNSNQLNSVPMDWQSTKVLTSTCYSSKIKKVVTNLQKLKLASAANKMEPIKSLVFSHWTRTLDCLGEALSCQGMLYVRIDGSLTIEQRRAAIHQFNLVPEIRTLLLSYGSGSVGLNLETATHVHLLEPHWNPMVEAQAAARVDRLDQTKNVFIYRYIVKDSIEENIQNAQRGKLMDIELSVSRMATGEDSNTNSNFMELRHLL
ncbi:SNF2 family N-terminal domain-containing protein [Bisporella sp. PMI_857]|nr:SNF2 family N-terminal domain-containing protein [Bisporella sp. PMI_857]